MKRVVLLVLDVYQLAISWTLRSLLGVPNMCRYSPSCSEYARIAITRFGIRKGSLLALRRLLSCHPFARPHKSAL